MENPKSLLELLKDEDKLKYDVRFNRETFNGRNYVLMKERFQKRKARNKKWELMY